MIGGPEVSRLIHDFENTSEKAAKDKHHEQTPSIQKSFGGDGFKDKNHEDVNEMIDTHSQPPTDKDLTDMTKSAGEEEEQGEPGCEEEEEEVGLALDRLSTLVRMIKKLQRLVQEWDPHILRSLQFANTIVGGMIVYKKFLAQKKKAAPATPHNHVPHTQEARSYPYTFT